jgi:hypothetical protein
VTILITHDGRDTIVQIGSRVRRIDGSLSVRAVEEYVNQQIKKGKR